jgi:hypothetical protein
VGGSVVDVNAGTPDPHHSADPSALEDPVHHDVALHELHEEHEEDEPAEEPAEQPEPSEQSAGEPAEQPDVAPEVEPTGDERVDAAVQRLGEVAQHPPAEHVAIYEDVHRRLQDTLADLDGS